MVPTSLTTSATIFFLLLLAIPICLEAKPLKLKQTQVVFYMHDWETGANVTAIPIAGLPKKPWAVGTFATIIPIDDALTETIDRNSAQIGRAQGIYVNSALDGSDLHFLMSVVFTNKQYNGSSLEIQGADRFFNKYREVSVVSGTGMFRLARGYAILETVYLDLPVSNAIIRWNVTFFQFSTTLNHNVSYTILIRCACSRNGAVLSVPGKIWSFTSFGTVFVTDDPITEAPDPNSAPVGRGRGMYITSALDGSTTHVLISIVFTNGQFSGSTLEIQGSSPPFQKYREVSVVSGTGPLRFARGYAIFETGFVDTPIGYSVIKCNVTIRTA
ncbi:hypothetical protein VitviT2T_017788 [Vitis vinifera]|uniref:Dirigent protein n=1 Tax=Vitis vinifera TaxID=29760 RepID=A0ABY9CXG9_VITVI|nr:hypothetical protein VitviT2T_017788 [Vitis vinifera]